MRRAEELAGWVRRWSVLDQGSVDEVRRAVVAADPQVGSPFGEVGGRVDLRGLPLRPDPSVGRVTIGDGGPSVWSGLDLSGADLREMTWADHRVVDCVLDDADLTNLRCWAVDVQRTSLRRACLHHGQLGAPSPVRPEASVWSDVDLTGADLRAAHGSHASLLRVDLHGARCAGAHWSDLVDCTFGGVVEGLTLGVDPGWGPDGAGGAVRLQGVDLTRARLRRFALVGVDLGQPEVGIAPPVDDEHWWVGGWPGFLEQVRERVATVADEDLRMVAEIWVDRVEEDRGARQTAGLVAVRDLRDLGGDALVGFLDEVRQGFVRTREGGGDAVGGGEGLLPPI